MSTNKNTALTFVVNNNTVSSSPTIPPNVTIVSVDHYKISNQSGIDKSDIVFKFDSDVTSWTVNVIGTSYNSGTVVASGGTVTLGSNVSVSIPWNDMYQEGNNQINIYGQNSIGWTPYMDNN